MSNSRACAEYLKSQNAYDRCFQEFRKKWCSYGRVAGKITLKDTSEAERKAIGGILGTVFYDKNIQFSFKKFEAGLQKTRYAPVLMREVLEAYFGKTLQTNQEEREEKQRQKHRFFREIQESFLNNFGETSIAVKWLNEVSYSQKYGYQLIIKEYGKNLQQAKKLVEHVGNALCKLEGLKNTQTEIPLAVFAANLSENPHYFDRNCVAGTLLIHGISYCQGVELPQNAHSWRELLQSVGIIPDNVSSMVHAFGLKLQTNDGFHPAYEAFCQRKEPCVITVENMREIVGAQALGKKVYIVENEMVFTYLVSSLQNRSCTLLCTSGQPRYVAQLLIPMILKSGAQIYYSGDIDPDGIGIADRLWQKFGDGICIWRMSLEDYEKSCSGEWIGESGIHKLEHICHQQLRLTAKAVQEKRFAGYQENILQELLQDIKKS